MQISIMFCSRLVRSPITVAVSLAVVTAVAERPLYRQTAEQEENDGRGHAQLIIQSVTNLSCPSYSHLTLFTTPSFPLVASDEDYVRTIRYMYGVRGLIA